MPEGEGEPDDGDAGPEVEEEGTDRKGKEVDKEGRLRLGLDMVRRRGGEDDAYLELVGVGPDGRLQVEEGRGWVIGVVEGELTRDDTEG